jgi:hypothetical protein
MCRKHKRLINVDQKVYCYYHSINSETIKPKENCAGLDCEIRKELIEVNSGTCEGRKCKKHANLVNVNGKNYCDYHLINPEMVRRKKSCYGRNCSTRKNIVKIDGKNYCEYHRENIHQTKFLLYNDQGLPLCHAFGCSVKDNLIEQYGGLFCKKHLPIIAELREKIHPHQSNYDEYQARLEELRFRKEFDPGHAYFLENLEKKFIK